MSILIADTPQTARRSALSIVDVSKAFGKKFVLQGIDLDVAQGEIVSIVGRSGCGKSTLLRVLSGLEMPSSGHIVVGGKSLTGLNRAARLMFQDAALLPWRTVLQNVELAAPNRDRHAARQALTHVGLGERANDWPTVLSGGQRQRVALARALSSRATILLFDEPLGALDALTRLDMQALIERLWDETGFTAVLITHDVEEAVALADRVLVMEAGHFVLEQPITLPRPRDRTAREFVDLRERILSRVLQS
ncbi:MAG TPA: ABC transporter ATP-binding protein [Chthoniobacterales bacterium]